MEKKVHYSVIKKINKQIFIFINKSLGTKRNIDEFKRNKIIFLTAKYNNKIIGCIPMEPRKFLINKKIYNTYFITNAFILDKFQNQNIGSKLLNKFNFKNKAKIFAFRHLIKDQASRWYKKNNFKNILDISSYILKIEKFKKTLNSFKLSNELINKIEINKSQKKIMKILKYRRSNFKKCSKRLYFYNYYKKFYNNSTIFYIYRKNKYFFMTLTFTKIGDSNFRYEIIDNNLSYKYFVNFLYFFCNSADYKKKYPIKIKLAQGTKLEKKLKRFFNKDKYKSNLLSNFILKKNKIEFNQIEYV